MCKVMDEVALGPLGDGEAFAKQVLLFIRLVPQLAFHHAAKKAFPTTTTFLSSYIPAATTMKRRATIRYRTSTALNDRTLVWQQRLCQNCIPSALER